MKSILERFEKLAAAHGLNADAAAAMRGLLNDANAAGYECHMALVADIADEEQDSLPGATGRDEDEPGDEDEKEEATLRALTKAMRKELRKTLKKEVRKQLHKHLQRIAPVAQ